MDHEGICDCRFLARCATHDDPLIAASRKGPNGFGCRQQSDVHRAKHCKAFACSYLTVLLSDIVKHPGSDTGQRQARP